MKLRSKMIKVLVTAILVFSMSMMTVHAAGASSADMAMPYLNNLSSAAIGIDFDTNNVVYITLSAHTYSFCSGISGLIKLFDSNGTCLQGWSVSDYDGSVWIEVTYQGTYGETYTATFGGYAYSNNGTAPDRLDLTHTGTCDNN